ncbi:glycosyltransferase family 2 protein [Muribaculum intestinale]|uniref:glycosyltransferase family 2 protein n=1 Tax=Muribaculum intestinale TaxID=1796646 RepID=UPI000F49EFA5|nr:glycosyltransferase family 2 protein [Muribaculum intestinale]ROT03715.1 glycosyltransferase [Muribaculaceae bacterium Isolate-100 (HZI)]RXE64094.1 glycosyltransferase [Muribaculaceae bacterium Isolate-007 (NCI)]
MQHLVSIITPSYNCAKYIEETIQSIQAQTYTNWELLITDDCSTDESVDIIRNYAATDSRIKLFILKENSGAGVARNNSIKEARGRFIAFCDSDDRWLPEKLERQVALLSSGDASIVYSSYTTCNEDGVVNGIVVAYRSINYHEILRDDSIGFLTCIYDTQRLGKIYMPTLRKRQDWGLKILLLKKAGYAIGIIEPLAIYRLRNYSLSNKKINLIKYNVKVYREILDYGLIRAWGKFLFDFMPHYIAKKLRLKIINQ